MWNLMLLLLVQISNPQNTVGINQNSCTEAQQFCENLPTRCSTYVNTLTGNLSQWKMSCAIWASLICWFQSIDCSQLDVLNIQGSFGCVAFDKTRNWTITDCNGNFNYMCQKADKPESPCNKTYFLGHDSGTWSVAQNNCRQNGGDLASIHSEEDQQAFNATRGSNTETLWIGLYWNTSTKSWKWSNGDTYQICKGNLLLVNEPKTWTGALKHCIDENSTLVHITNSTVQNNVSRLLNNQSFSSGVWVGLERSYLTCNGPWFWVGGPQVNYSQWSVNFTKTPPQHYCGKVFRSDDNTVLWQDGHCEEKLPFICQGIDQNGYGFSTKDRDNDGCSPCIFGDIAENSCSWSEGSGGWWYSRCGSASLHGDWHPAGDNKGWASGLHWLTWKGPGPYSAKATRMRVRAE